MIRRFCKGSAQQMRRCGVVAVAAAFLLVVVCVVAGGVAGAFVSSQLPWALTSLIGALIGLAVGVPAAWVMLGAVLGARARQAPPELDSPQPRPIAADEPADRPRV